jgi:RecA/RadA recombinase
MSSAVLSTSAALGRPFLFDAEPEPERPLSSASEHTGMRESLLARFQSTIKNQQSKIPPARVTPASQLENRPAPEMASSGIPAIDALTGGLPRGCLTEICGPASSGRTSLLLAALAAATRRGEFCVVVDASDALDPHSAAAAGVELNRLLWVRCGEDRNLPTPQNGCPISRASLAREACPEFVERVGTSSPVTFNAAFDFNRADLKENVHKNDWKNNDWKKNDLQKNVSRQSEHRLEQVLRATDLLLESGGFGLIVLDLGDLPTQSARRIPLTTWFRFRRSVENKPTILLAIEQQAIAGSCSSLLLHLGPPSMEKNNFLCPTHTQLLTGLNISAELIRSRLDRKPVRSVRFATKTAWAG